MEINFGKFRFSYGAGNGFFNSRPTMMLGQEGAAWVNTDKPRELYETIPQLYIPVNKLAMMFSNAEIKVENENGEDVGTDEFYKLIQNPNFIQSMNEWLYSFLVQKLVYGNAFMYKYKASPLSKEPTALWNLSPAYITPIYTGKTFQQVDLSGVIEKYRYCENGKIDYYPTDVIMYTRIVDLDNPFIGRSPLISMRFPLTNTKLAYEYQNVIMGKKGAIGVLSPEATKDSMGATPFLSKHKDDIIKQHLNTYGIQDGQTPLMISDTPMKWMPMSYPTKDLLLAEQIDANFMTILDTLGINRNMFGNSTFENQKTGYIQTYEDTIYPHADEFAQAFTKFLGITNGKVVLKYNHLAILQDDKNALADTFQKQINAVTQLYEKNLIDKKEQLIC